MPIIIAFLHCQSNFSGLMVYLCCKFPYPTLIIATTHWAAAQAGLIYCCKFRFTKWTCTITQRMQHQIPWYSSTFTISNTLSICDYNIPSTPHLTQTCVMGVYRIYGLHYAYMHSNKVRIL